MSMSTIESNSTQIRHLSDNSRKSIVYLTKIVWSYNSSTNIQVQRITLFLFYIFTFRPPKSKNTFRFYIIVIIIRLYFVTLYFFTVRFYDYLLFFPKSGVFRKKQFCIFYPIIFDIYIYVIIWPVCTMRMQITEYVNLILLIQRM